MENKIPIKILVLFLNEDRKIIGKIKEIKPIPICKNDNSCSIEKIKTPLKSKAIKMLTINFIPFLYIKRWMWYPNSGSIQHHHFEQLV